VQTILEVALRLPQAIVIIPLLRGVRGVFTSVNCEGQTTKLYDINQEPVQRT